MWHLQVYCVYSKFIVSTCSLKHNGDVPLKKKKSKYTLHDFLVFLKKNFSIPLFIYNIYFCTSCITICYVNLYAAILLDFLWRFIFTVQIIYVSFDSINIDCPKYSIYNVINMCVYVQYTFYMYSIHLKCFSRCLRHCTFVGGFCTQSAGAALAADVETEVWR